MRSTHDLFVTALAVTLKNQYYDVLTLDSVTGQQMGMEEVESKKPKEWTPSLSSSWPQFFPGWQQMLPVRWTGQWQWGPKKQHSQVLISFQQETGAATSADWLSLNLEHELDLWCLWGFSLLFFSDTWMICTHLSFVRVPVLLDGIYQSHMEFCLLPERATLLWYTQKRRAGNLAW